MLYLWIFGDNIEDRLGHVRFLVFYLVWPGGGTHPDLHPSYLKDSHAGGAGAVAGVLGAYLILFPHAHVLALIPILFFFQIVELPLYCFVFWFLMQFLNGVIAITGAPYLTGGVAWWAPYRRLCQWMALGFLFPKRKR